VTLAVPLAWQGLQLYVLGDTGSVNVTDPEIVALANHFYSDAAGLTVRRGTDRSCADGRRPRGAGSP